MNNTRVEIVGLENKDRIVDLAKGIYSHRLESPEYGHYLLEKKPDSYHPIAEDLIGHLEKDRNNHRLYMICKGTKNDLGYILLKNYSEVVVDFPATGGASIDTITPNVEASYRSMKAGLCGDALRLVLIDLFTSPSHKHIKTVLGHHAKDNIASGMVFHGNGFAGLRYHYDYVTLPNLRGGVISDTIMWRLDVDTFHSDAEIHKTHPELKTHLRQRPVRMQSSNGCGPKIQSRCNYALNSSSKK